MTSRQNRFLKWALCVENVAWALFVENVAGVVDHGVDELLPLQDSGDDTMADRIRTIHANRMIDATVGMTDEAAMVDRFKC